MPRVCRKSQDSPLYITHDTASPRIKPFIRFDGLMELTGLAKTTLFELQDPDSPHFDEKMPPAYQITARTKLWKSAEILAWIESRIVVNGKQAVVGTNGAEVGNV